MIQDLYTVLCVIVGVFRGELLLGVSLSQESIALEESGSRTGSDIVDALEETKVGEVRGAFCF